MDRRPLLTLKLSIPATPPWLLGRDQLTAALKDGLQQRLTALIAPAGYGKSTVLAAFLAQVAVPVVWLQLDDRDNDLPRLTRYLGEGVRTLAPDSATLAYLRPGGPCAVDDVAEVLAGDLGRFPALALVLDDLHLLAAHGEAVALVERLLEIAPLSVHFYIASRRPLPFSVARLKARQQARVLTVDDLRFAPAEVEQALAAWAPGVVGPAEMARLIEQTEGWPAALVLAADALRRGLRVAQVPGKMPEDLIAYLAEEVLPGLSPDLQAFMEQTSILAVCTSEMCDALLGRSDSAAVLSELVAGHPLVTWVQHDVARYHALLRQVLDERLQKREGGALVRRLHLKAGELHARQGLVEEAVAHYLRAGNLDEASALVARLAPRWINSRQTDRMRPILEMLPAGSVDTHPWLCVCAGWVQHTAGNSEAVMGLAERARAQFAADGDVRGQVHALLLAANARSFMGDGKSALAICEQARAMLLPGWEHELAFVLSLTAMASLQAGKPLGEAIAAAEEARRIYVDTGDPAGEARVCTQLGPFYMRMGEQLRAINVLEKSTDLYRQLGDPPSELGLNLAWAYSEVGRFESARSIYEAILWGSVRKARRANAALNLIDIYARLGLFAEAFRLGALASNLAREVGSADHGIMVRTSLAAAYRLAGEYDLALKEIRETLRQAMALGQPLVILNTRTEAALLHLAHTGNTAAVGRLAAKALREIAPGYHPKEITLLRLADAVAAFRQDRSGTRSDAAGRLRLALGDCLDLGYEAVVLQEWPLGLAAIIYGLAFGVLPDYCARLLRLMAERLPAAVRQRGVAMAEPDARHLPAAWRALPDAADRDALAALVAPEERQRLEGLGEGPVPLRVACLGPLTVEVGGRSVDPGALKKRKVGPLLVLLLGQERWTREQLLEALWPDLDADAAGASLRVALHHLRRLLEPHLGGRDRSRYLQAGGGVVCLQRQPELSVDLDEFGHHWRSGKAAAVAGDGAGALRHFAAARSLYRGPLYSDDPYTPALEPLRHQVQGFTQQLLLWLGEHYRQSQDEPQESLACYRELLLLDPTDEAAYQGLMHTHMLLGQWPEALQQYQECRRQLQQALGVEPSPATQALLGDIHRQQAKRGGRLIPLKKDRTAETGSA